MFLLTMAVPLIACAVLLQVLARRLDNDQSSIAPEVVISKPGVPASS
jgi:hypothetical protein